MHDLRSHLLGWLNRIDKTSPPTDEIRAFNFGLFETPSGFAAYLIGSTVYDVDDDDWACAEDYTPTERYLDLSKQLGTKDWQAVEREVLTALKDVLSETLSMPDFLNRAEYITTGFDDGNLCRVK